MNERQADTSVPTCLTACSLPLGRFNDRDRPLPLVWCYAVGSVTLGTLRIAGITELEVATPHQQRAALTRPGCVVAFGSRLSLRAAHELHRDQLQFESVVEGFFSSLSCSSERRTQPSGCARLEQPYRLPLGRRLGACVNAEPATLRTGFGVLGFRSSLLAIEATGRDVLSFLAICIHLLPCSGGYTPPVFGERWRCEEESENRP